MRFTRIRLGIYTALAFLAAFPGVNNARAQDIECQRGDLEVFRLVFEGNHAFSDAELARTISAFDKSLQALQQEGLA